MAGTYQCDGDSAHGEPDFTVSTMATGDTKFLCVGCFVEFASAVADSLLQAMGGPVAEEAEDATHSLPQGGRKAPRSHPRPRLAVRHEPDHPEAVETPQTEDDAAV